jgi:4'-phosphopantetheinyl transferase EntD
MLASILPAAAVAEAMGSLPESEAELFGDEARLIGRAVEKRRREFACGRTLARRALTQLGRPPTAIPVGPQREPVWPSDIVGSITHCDGYCAAAVAPANTIRSLGIDAEPDARLPAGVVSHIAREDERRRIRDLAADVQNWDRVLFSAKESVFKAWFPITRMWLEFDDVTLHFEPPTRSFRVTLATPNAEPAPLAAQFQGRYMVTGGLILTCVVWPR